MNVPPPDHPAFDAAFMIGCDALGGVAPPEQIGFKAHNLARMAALGLPVPPAFVLGTRWCARQSELCSSMWRNGLNALERKTGLQFGDARRPLLLSVRSGAPVSMPGMMESLLNIGLCDTTLPGMVRLTGNPRLAWDSYRRLIASYGEIVRGISAEAFAVDRASLPESDDSALDFAQLRKLAEAHLLTFRRECGKAFPQDPATQLAEAIVAVYASWHSPKACEYRKMRQIADRPGTAVTVQRMVFGNAGGISGAGVGFSRDPSSGAPAPWVDFMFDAQGEDVVSGRRNAAGQPELATVAPRVWAELVEAGNQLENAFGDMQDFEFTVEDGQLFLLQTRNGKRTPQAAARIALDLCESGVIDAREALRRTAGLDEAALAVTRLASDDGRPDVPLAMANSASNGIATGEVALDEAHAKRRHDAGARVILVRRDAETADIAALDIAAGMLTRHGARTSHAAVVARSLGKVCLVGCESMHIDLEARRATFGGKAVAEGELLTIDGNTGQVHRGALRAIAEVPEGLLDRLYTLRVTQEAAQK